MPGGLYRNVQPIQIGGSLLNIMESERQRRLANQTAQAKQMAEERAKLFEGFDKLDVEGEFLSSSVQAMDEARKAKVQLYNSKARGEISETDYLIASERIDQIPSLLNASYQSVEEKKAALMEGDEKMNYDALNGIQVATTGIGLKYNPKTNDLDVSYNSIDGGRKTVPRSQFQQEVLGAPVVSKLGSPLQISDDIGYKFKADLTQKNRLTEQGLGVGESRSRFDSDFKATFGERTDGRNPLVNKMMTDRGGDTYENTWDFLYGNAEAKIANTKRKTPTPVASTKVVDPNKDLNKMNFTILSEKGKDIKTIKTKGGDIEGIGAAFKMSDTGQKFDLGVGDIEGIPADIADTIKVNAIFISDDGELYIKGSANQLDKMAKMIDDQNLPEGEKKKAEEAIAAMFENRKRGIDWLKVGGIGETDIRANIFNGRSLQDMTTYLRGIGKEEVKEGGRSKNFIKNVNKVRRSRVGVRDNEDGGESSHIMAWGDDGKGNYYAYPTLFQRKNGEWYEPENAEDEARKKGEIYKFDSKQEAIDFAAGAWKPEEGKPTKDFG